MRAMQWNDSEHLAVCRRALDERLGGLWKAFERNLFKEALWHEMPEREEYYSRRTEIKTVAYVFPTVVMYIFIANDFHITINIRLNPGSDRSKVDRHFFKLSEGQEPDRQILRCLAATERRLFLIHALAKLEPIQIVLAQGFLVEFFFKKGAFGFIKCIVAVDEQLTVLSHESYIFRPTDNPPPMAATHFKRIDELVHFIQTLQK